MFSTPSFLSPDFVSDFRSIIFWREKPEVIAESERKWRSLEYTPNFPEKKRRKRRKKEGEEGEEEEKDGGREENEDKDKDTVD